MEQLNEGNVIVRERRQSWEWARLIRKLRWIGLENEARCLETAVSMLPAEEAPSVAVDPFRVD